LKNKYNSKQQGVRPRGSANGNPIQEIHTTLAFHHWLQLIVYGFHVYYEEMQ
jgi:hypothetical protein